jgi:hypothetical protein
MISSPKLNKDFARLQPMLVANGQPCTKPHVQFHFELSLRNLVLITTASLLQRVLTLYDSGCYGKHIYPIDFSLTLLVPSNNAG